MAIYNVHAGHAPAHGTGCGAVGVLNESIEARLVKDYLIGYLRAAGHTAYDCTYEQHASASTVLKEIVKKCNEHDVVLDISIHLNSGRNDQYGDSDTAGPEVWGYSNSVKAVGEAISLEIANALGMDNRGFKINQGFYVLKKTKSKAIIIECCFVDDADDAKRWDAQKCAKAIFKGLTGSSVTEKTTVSNTITVPKLTTPYIYAGVDYKLVFDPTYYADNHPDVKKEYGTNVNKLLKHFVQFGMKEQRQACAWFNVQSYKNNYEDLQEEFGNNMPKYYRHYIQYGYKENRRGY